MPDHAARAPEPSECDGCGAPEGTLSIYSTMLGMAWCCRVCKEGGRCECRRAALEGVR